MFYDRMSGLDSEQLDELVWRIKDQLEEPWRKGIGRPKSCCLREAVIEDYLKVLSLIAAPA